MTLNYETSLKLKEIGVEQIGGDGWYCLECKVFGENYTLTHEVNCRDYNNKAAVPDLKQIINELEGLDDILSVHIDYIYQTKEWLVTIAFRIIDEYINREPFSSSDPDLLTALSYLYLELKEES